MTTVTNEPRLSENYDVADEVIDYRAVSRAAVAGLILGLIGILSIWLAPLISVSVVGLILSIMAVITVARYPTELTGKPIAWIGVLLNTILLIIAPYLHIHTYLTEVPEGYTRTSFSLLKGDKYGVDYPPPTALELNGKSIFIKGYIHPTSVAGGAVQKFILVPDIGTCCFGGQPKLTHMIEVKLTGDQYARYAMRQIKVAGILHVDPQLKPIPELQGVYYELGADHYWD